MILSYNMVWVGTGKVCLIHYKGALQGYGTPAPTQILGLVRQWARHAARMTSPALMGQVAKGLWRFMGFDLLHLKIAQQSGKVRWRGRRNSFQVEAEQDLIAQWQAT